MEMDTEFKFDIDLAPLSLEELEQKALDYRLAREANARMVDEANHAKELERQKKIIEIAKTLLPAALQDRVTFSHYAKNQYEYLPILVIDAGNWRMLMQMHNVREVHNEWTWSIDRQGFIPTCPQLYNDDERGWIVTWPTLQGTNDLLEAIEMAMDHPDVIELQIEASQRNADGIKPALKEPVYVKADQPQNTDVVGPLVQLIRDVAKEVFDEQSL